MFTDPHRRIKFLYFRITGLLWFSQELDTVIGDELSDNIFHRGLLQDAEVVDPLRLKNAFWVRLITERKRKHKKWQNRNLNNVHTKSKRYPWMFLLIMYRIPLAFVSGRIVVFRQFAAHNADRTATKGWRKSSRYKCTSPLSSSSLVTLGFLYLSAVRSRFHSKESASQK